MKIRSAELIGALSHALDITEGQPRGHCHRVCWMGMKLGQGINMPREELADLYYALLLKDLGCSSNAARICQLYLADDRKFKADFKLIDGSLSQALRFVLTHTGLESGMAERFRAIINIMRNGGQISRELIEARCHRGADIARQMGFSEAVAGAVQNLDEHWDGSGKPEGRLRREIPVASQIALMAQVADVFYMAGGREAATREIEARAGTWFDADLVQVFINLVEFDEFWEPLAAPDLASRIMALEPEEHIRLADEDYLDRVAKGFAMVVDSKSPFTAGHSTRVALYADMIAERLGLPAAQRRQLTRAALLHDIGKLGISNGILDKPAKLTEAEFATIKSHPTLSAEILRGIPALANLVPVAEGHHERLDGKGYPRGLKGSEINLDTRICTVADVFDALTADRPYRKAMAVGEALALMQKDVGAAFDARCFAALADAMRDMQQAAA
ncbi:MAG: HD-GYP domain-containing protein [Alphaproteobacteria bacterium]|nr:HD-GYP domain-containing protein [Alphaproteobacteria bacterium]